MFRQVPGPATGVCRSFNACRASSFVIGPGLRDETGRFVTVGPSIKAGGSALCAEMAAKTRPRSQPNQQACNAAGTMGKIGTALANRGKQFQGFPFISKSYSLAP